MPTLVCFHAHPDDECIQTGGVMAKASDEGHRVVLVVATRGEHGEVADGFLDPGEELWQRREKETHAAAAALGVHRVEFLGYHDSGMIDTPENEAEGSFWQADVEEAAEKLAAILREESTDVLTIYDDHGGYGHPDHIQVHRVGRRAAELAGVEKVFQCTMNRTELIELTKNQPPPEGMTEEDRPTFDDDSDFGSPIEIITCRVDVAAWTDRKRAAMRAHASQIADDHFMLTMPDEAFATVFGVEWYIRDGEGPGITETQII
jgi:LmbE family N-acetylglucosaminyl deacetylase